MTIIEEVEQSFQDWIKFEKNKHEFWFFDKNVCVSVKIFTNCYSMEWYQNGQLHREDGPAVDCGLTGYKAWYKNGSKLKEDWDEWYRKDKESKDKQILYILKNVPELEGSSPKRCEILWHGFCEKNSNNEDRILGKTWKEPDENSVRKFQKWFCSMKEIFSENSDL